ncbi:MAG: transcription antitermination factor NusB [Endozoicomonadaceae bacterium]|nr:transcription antitermination factor NusB [Endozoicomonadaceae bacterium]
MRRKSREMVVQALYQLALSGGSITATEQQFITEGGMKKADSGYFHDLLYGIAKNMKTLDDHVSSLLDRPFNQLDPVEVAILRLGCFELLYRTDIPYRVIINESIEIAKLFGAQDSHKYINGILDKLAVQIRKEEVAAFTARWKTAQSKT